MDPRTENFKGLNFFYFQARNEFGWSEPSARHKFSTLNPSKTGTKILSFYSLTNLNLEYVETKDIL